MADRHESPTANSSAPANVLTTKIDPTSARFEANMRFLADLMSQVRNEEEKICEGGGVKAIESQHAKTQQGTGLGLALTKSLVEMHGGLLDLRSAPGQGTSAIFSLPVSQASVALAAVAR